MVKEQTQKPVQLWQGLGSDINKINLAKIPLSLHNLTLASYSKTQWSSLS